MKKELIEVQKRLIKTGYLGQAFSYGNAKLPSSTLIVNLSSANHCPAKARGLCKVAHCYALKCERVYPNYKKKNLTIEEWLRNARTVDIVALMLAYIDNARTPITHIRLDEAGDFYDQNQVRQWNKIARIMWKARGIKTYTYTARNDLDFTCAPYIMVNASNPGTSGAVREFLCTPRQVYDNLTPKRGEYKCPGDCKKCKVCYSPNNITRVYCREH